MVRAIILATLAFTFAVPAAAADPTLVRMGTGNVAGVYFPVGVALCRLVNETRREHGIRCSARPSEGSLANISDLRAATDQLAIVQSDVQASALEGTGAFAQTGPMPDLRAVFSLHAEPLTIVARADSGIASLADLRGKRVAIGNPGSGQRATMERLIAALGWTSADLAATPEIETDDLSGALCDGAIDAFALAVGHPALVIQEATNECASILVPVEGPAVDGLVAAEPAYFETAITGGLYRGNPRDIPTFGVGATLVTRAEEPDAVINTMVRAIFGDFDTLKGLNPTLTRLDPATMVTEGLTAPLHPGAASYYRERGWLN